MVAWRDDPYKKYCRDAKATRQDYLRQLAEDYGVDRKTVYTLADMLGPSEDFDGLISEIDGVSDLSAF